jgi:hypothetical protein
VLIREIRVKYFRFIISDVSFGGWDDFNAALSGDVLRVRHPRSGQVRTLPMDFETCPNWIQRLNSLLA